MARNSEAGVVSKEVKKLLKEEKETEKRTEEVHAENVKATEESARIGIENAKTDKGVTVSKENETKRKARYKALLEAYEIQNPVKFAAKKAAGAFDEIPKSF